MKGKYAAQYQKERKRVQAMVKRALERGYLVPKDFVPPIPKKITSASVSRLKKLTPDALYKKSKHLDYETGEIIPGRLARQQERVAAGKKAAYKRQGYVSYDDKVVKDIYERIGGASGSHNVRILRKLLKQIVKKYGARRVREYTEKYIEGKDSIERTLSYFQESIHYLKSMMNDFLDYEIRIKELTGVQTIDYNKARKEIQEYIDDQDWSLDFMDLSD